MRHITIALPDPLYLDLVNAAGKIEDHGYTPEIFAADVVISELASRRLPTVMAVTPLDVYSRKPVQFAEDS